MGYVNVEVGWLLDPRNDTIEAMISAFMYSYNVREQRVELVQDGWVSCERLKVQVIGC